MSSVRLTIAGLAGGGRGVSRHAGAVWLVAGALPGEVVEAVAERRRAGVVEARAVEVRERSPWRAEGICPAAGSCGGCDLAHVAAAARPAVLREVTRGALRHAPPALAELVSSARMVAGSGENWRLRARLHWDPDANTLGFRRARSHRVTRIHSCRAISLRLSALLPELEARLAQAALPPGELEWLEDLDGARAVVGFRGPGWLPPFRGLDGFWRLLRRGSAEGWGATGVTMALPIPLAVPVGAFFQGNRALVPALFRRVAELVRGSGVQRVVDLYGGVGFFAAAARAAGVEDITLVEGNAVAAAAARVNLPGVRVVAGSCEAFVGREGVGGERLVIVDPPRAGLSPQVRQALARGRPAWVLLLSCDAGRFGRDAAALGAAGYHCCEIELWDMFPLTHHVEILALFRPSP